MACFSCLCCLALFFWSAFDCVWLLFLCVLFLVSFRFALLPVASAYLFLLPFPLVLHGEGKYQMQHNVASDILSVRRSPPKPRTVGHSRSGTNCRRDAGYMLTLPSQWNYQLRNNYAVDISLFKCCITIVCNTYFHRPSGPVQYQIRWASSDICTADGRPFLIFEPCGPRHADGPYDPELGL